MKELLLSIIGEAIKDEFWSSESVLVEQYYEQHGKQLDCEGISIEYHAADTLHITIGPEQYTVQITSSKEDAR